jgi:hypothetical protein
MSDKFDDSVNEAFSQHSATEHGLFEYNPVSPEENALIESSSDSTTSSLMDVPDLVLLLESAQLIWHLQSLFCYRGLLQDDKKKSLLSEPLASQQEVVLTIGTGMSPILLHIAPAYLVDATAIAKLRNEWNMY